MSFFSSSLLLRLRAIAIALTNLFNVDDDKIRGVST